MGRGARSRAGLKVRQPLSRVVVIPRNEDEERHIVEVRTQILEELNIKELEVAAGSSDGDAGDGLYRRALEAAGGGEARAGRRGAPGRGHRERRPLLGVHRRRVHGGH